MSLEIAVSSSTLLLRLSTLGRRSDLVLIPFVWSQTRWFAIDADPPLPHEKTVARRAYASDKMTAARSNSAKSSDFHACTIS